MGRDCRDPNRSASSASAAQTLTRPEPGDGAAHVVAGQQRAERRRPLHEVVALPERRPRDQHQQQPCFEQQGDEEEPPEQGLASRLDFGQPIDAAGDVAVAARFGFELDEHRQRARAARRPIRASWPGRRAARGRHRASAPALRRRVRATRWRARCPCARDTAGRASTPRRSAGAATAPPLRAP